MSKRGKGEGKETSFLSDQVFKNKTSGLQQKWFLLYLQKI